MTTVIVILSLHAITVHSDNLPSVTSNWLIPITVVLAYLALACVSGGLIVCGFFFAHSSRESALARDFSAVSAAVLAIIAGVIAVLDGMHGEIRSEWLVASGLAAITALICFLASGRAGLVVCGALTLVLTVVISASSPESRSDSSDLSARLLHGGSAVVWVGTLTVLMVVFSVVDTERLTGIAGVQLRRYAALALSCFIGVVLSGVVLAADRLSAGTFLLTPYGVLILVKTLIVLVLGVFAYGRRRVDGSRYRSRLRLRSWFLVGELLLLSAASGVAVLLPIANEFSSPSSQSGSLPQSPSDLLTGHALPQQPTAVSWVFGGTVDALWLYICAAALVWYGVGVLRLRRLGDRWPYRYTLAWVGGVVLLFFATNGGVRVYATYLFSARVVMMMILATLVPLLLVGGAPMRLAARTLRSRIDDSWGAREWVRAVSRSRLRWVFASPTTATVLFAVSLWAFAVGPLLRPSVTNVLWGEWMTFHLLIAGVLAVGALSVSRAAYARKPLIVRLIPLAIAAGFFAGVGMVLMNYGGLFVADWFGAMGRTWGASPSADQRYAAYPVWILGGFWVIVLLVGEVLRHSPRHQLRGRLSESVTG